MHCCADDRISGCVTGLDGSPGKRVVVHPDPASCKLFTGAAGPHVLRLRLTDVLGWHASSDGRSVPVQAFAGMILQVDVPPGSHTVERHNHPATFTVGIAIALLAVIGLLSALLVSRTHRPRRQ